MCRFQNGKIFMTQVDYVMIVRLYIRGRSGKYLAYKRKTKILEKWRKKNDPIQRREKCCSTMTTMAPAHTSAVATGKLVELGYELLLHPPYSRDLALCYFFLFPNLKKSLIGQIFELNEEIIAGIYFADLQKTFLFQTG